MKEFFDKIDLNKSILGAKKNSFIAGYLITLSNPMTIVWWVGVFGSIISPTIHSALANSFAIIGGVLLWFLTLSLLLHWGNKFINKKTMKYVSLIAGLIIIGFGLYFGYNAVISIV